MTLFASKQTHKVFICLHLGNMVHCDNCNQPVFGGILVDVMMHIEGQDSDIPQKWCLDCIRGTEEERQGRGQRS